MCRTALKLVVVDARAIEVCGVRVVLELLNDGCKEADALG